MYTLCHVTFIAAQHQLNTVPESSNWGIYGCVLRLRHGINMEKFILIYQKLSAIIYFMCVYHKCDSLHYNSATHSMTNCHTWKMSNSMRVHRGSGGPTWNYCCDVSPAYFSSGCHCDSRHENASCIGNFSSDSRCLTRGIVPSGFHRVSSLAKGGHFVNHLFNDPRNILVSQKLPNFYGWRCIRSSHLFPNWGVLMGWTRSPEMARRHDIHSTWI